MGLQDMPYAVTTHSLHFSDGFFARLGTRFLTHYYRTYLDGPTACAVVSEIDGAVCGYLVGVLDTPRHRGLLLTYHGRALTLAAALGMLRRPWLAAIFVRTRLRRYVRALARGRQSLEAFDAGGPVAVLSHVVVSAEDRCHGVGTALVDKFLRQAELAGCRRACLVTLAGDRGAGEFYERRGWTRTHQRSSSPGRDLVYYAIDLH